MGSLEEDGDVEVISSLNVIALGQKYLAGGADVNRLLALIEEFSICNIDGTAELLDALSVLDCEAESLGDVARTRFKDLFSKLSEALVSEDVLKLNVDSTCESDNAISQRIVKTKTKLYYKQLKFNLLREESEGYAKLIVELNQPMDSAFTHMVAFERIRSLIGQFNLDPNRVLDIILESFETQPANRRFFIPLIQLYNAAPEDVVHLLGFKFTFYQKETNKRREDTPPSLYKLAAILVKDPQIKLDLLLLLTYLKPTQEDILEQHKAVVDAGAEKLRKASSMALSSNQDQDSTPESDEEQLLRNQKLMLLLSLIELGDWKHAKDVLDRLPEFFAVRFLPIAKALCAFVDNEIDELYETLCKPKHYLKTASQSQAKRLQRRTEFSVKDLKDLHDVIFPILRYLGVYVAASPSLVTRLIRLCSVLVAQRSTNGELYSCFAGVVDLCEAVLLPSLSMMSGNCGVSEQLWTLISQFAYPVRYRLYGRWKSEHMKKHPQLMISMAEIMGKTKYIMKRLSKETTKQTGRQLAKLCHTHPTVVFEYILTQIQQFENLIGPVIESLKFLTNLSYDVLAYCIIEELANPEKEKMKVAEITLSAWLQSLATFVGAVFKKYNIELTGVLQYVANQLKAGKSYDLLVLREIIQNMSGVETTANLTQEQLEALAGGDLLKQEGGYLSQVRNTKRSTNRLKDALLQEDLVISLCLLMAQQRGSIIYKEGTNVHLKLVGQMIDQCQESLVQFGSFLATNLRPEDYIKRMPSVDQLIQTYHLGHDAAFFLAQPMYSHAIRTKYVELKKADKSKSMTVEKKAQHYLAACDAVLKPLVEKITHICYSLRVWQSISTKFFVTFWTLNMYDLHLPSSSYDREIEKMRKSLENAEESKDLSDNKRRKEKERCQQFENKLIDEQRKQAEHVARVLERLRLEKDDWFPGVTPKGQTICNILQHCIFPRCLFTDLDALYCAKIYTIIHQLNTPNFWTVYGYDKMFLDITPILAGLSENESHHYGRFLCAMLQQVMKWYGDKSLFEKDCANALGFATKYTDTPDPEDKAILDLVKYKHAVFKWHGKLTIALVQSLKAKQWILVRNALIILLKLSPVYPVISDQYDDIEKAVSKVREEQKQKRPDLHVLATSYFAHLRTKRSSLVLEEDFHQVSANTRKALQAKRAQAAKMAAAEEKEKEKEREKEKDNSASAGGGSSRNAIGSSSSTAARSSNVTLSMLDGPAGGSSASKAASPAPFAKSTSANGPASSSSSAAATAKVTSTVPTASTKACVHLKLPPVASTTSLEAVASANAASLLSAPITNGGGDAAIAGSPTRELARDEERPQADAQEGVALLVVNVLHKQKPTAVALKTTATTSATATAAMTTAPTTTTATSTSATAAATQPTATKTSSNAGASSTTPGTSHTVKLASKKTTKTDSDAAGGKQQPLAATKPETSSAAAATTIPPPPRVIVLATADPATSVTSKREILAQNSSAPAASESTQQASKLKVTIKAEPSCSAQPLPASVPKAGKTSCSQKATNGTGSALLPNEDSKVALSVALPSVSVSSVDDDSSPAKRRRVEADASSSASANKQIKDDLSPSRMVVDKEKEKEKEKTSSKRKSQGRADNATTPGDASVVNGESTKRVKRSEGASPAELKRLKLEDDKTPQNSPAHSSGGSRRSGHHHHHRRGDAEKEKEEKPASAKKESSASKDKADAQQRATTPATTPKEKGRAAAEQSQAVSTAATAATTGSSRGEEKGVSSAAVLTGTDDRRRSKERRSPPEDKSPSSHRTSPNQDVKKKRGEEKEIHSLAPTKHDQDKTSRERGRERSAGESRKDKDTERRSSSRKSGQQRR